jgi:hypothetical protein
MFHTPRGASERLWREDKMNGLLDEHVASMLFISGCIENQSLFWPAFGCRSRLSPWLAEAARL